MANMTNQKPKKGIDIKQTKSNYSKPLDLNIPGIFQNNYFYFALILILVFAFFGPGIFGNGFNASDTIASESFKKYLEEAKNSGIFPQWVPYIFSGMPSFAGFVAHGDRIWDFISLTYFKSIEYFSRIFGTDEARVALHYVIYGIGVFLLMLEKKQNKMVAFFTTLAAVFSTGIVVWIMIGHNTKPVVFSMYPWVFLFLERLKTRFSLLYSVLLVIAIHIMLEATHVQMIFYGGIAFGLYLLYNLIGAAIKKQTWNSFLIPSIVLVVAFGLSFLLSSDRYLSVREYTPSSTRGSAPIVQQTQGEKQTKDGGHDYNYATQWSFSPGETFTFLVPNYYGFGKVKYTGPETGNKEAIIPTYWGQKPFEDAAPYMGIFVFMFAIIGFIYNRKDLFVQFLAFLSVFALLLSFGYTLPFIYDIFYYNMPFFNKFRAPSMVLALINFAFPILAGYGISSLITLAKDEPEKGRKLAMYMIYSSVGFLLLAVLFSAAFKLSYIEAIASSASFRLPEQFREFVYNNMITDWFINAFLLVIVSLLSFFFIKRKVNFSTFMIALFVLVVFDLWRVGYRPMEVAEEKLSKVVFASDDAIDFVKQDQSTYRVADFASKSPNVAAHYLLQNVNGYHAAKLRVYQDMLDATSGGSTSNVTSPFMWNLLNVKYILAKEDFGMPPAYQSSRTGTRVYLNQSYLPRAFFVESAEKSTPTIILNHLKNGDFDPRKVAYYHNESSLNCEIPDSSVYAKVTSYKNEEISLDVNASGNNLLVISEVYYPDWYAYLDGKKLDVHQINYLLRGVIVPKGIHKLVLKFEDDTFVLGKNLSLATNVLMFVLLILGIFFELKRKKIPN